jgi:hypothetical protein
MTSLWVDRLLLLAAIVVFLTAICVFFGIFFDAWRTRK